jgi:hypothetical protein
MEINNVFNYTFILFSFYVQRAYEKTRRDQNTYNNYGKYLKERQAISKRLGIMCNSLSLDLFSLSMAIPSHIVDKIAVYKQRSPSISIADILRQVHGQTNNNCVIPDFVVNDEINPELIKTLINLQNTRVIHWQTFYTILRNNSNFGIQKTKWEKSHPGKKFELELFNLTGNPIWLYAIERLFNIVSVDEIKRILNLILDKKFLFASNYYDETKTLVRLINLMSVTNEGDFLKLKEIYKLAALLSGYAISLREALCYKMLDAYKILYFSTERMKKFDLIMKFLRKEKTSDIWSIVFSKVHTVYYADIYVTDERTSWDYKTKTDVKIPPRIHTANKSHVNELLEFYTVTVADKIKYVGEEPYAMQVFKRIAQNPNTTITEEKK